MVKVGGRVYGKTGAGLVVLGGSTFTPVGSLLRGLGTGRVVGPPLNVA